MEPFDEATRVAVAASEAPTPVPPAPPGGGEPTRSASSPTELDRVREILFGAELRDVDSRFVHLEANLAAGLATLAQQAESRHQEFDSQVRAAFDELRRRVAADNQRFSELLAGLSDELRRVDWRLQEHGAMLRSRMDVMRGDLQQSMVSSLGAVESQLSAAHGELGARLSARLEVLEDATVERRKLADALDTIARELRTTVAR
ncbi:MAG: hypothetical protein U0Q12_18635 [Vicinamibacterales bacterium]